MCLGPQGWVCSCGKGAPVSERKWKVDEVEVEVESEDATPESSKKVRRLEKAFRSLCDHLAKVGTESCVTVPPSRILINFIFRVFLCLSYHLQRLAQPPQVPSALHVACSSARRCSLYHRFFSLTPREQRNVTHSPALLPQHIPHVQYSFSLT